MRQAGPLDDGDPRQQLLEDRPHRASAEQQRLVAAAQMQNTVGEDMAALQIAGELYFVDGDERGARLARHGLDGADGISAHCGGEIFSSPVTSATFCAPTFSTTRV